MLNAIIISHLYNTGQLQATKNSEAKKLTHLFRLSGLHARIMVKLLQRFVFVGRRWITLYDFTVRRVPRV